MLELNWSGHLNHFKSLIGQTNHYLITILVGLEGVRTGKVTKDETFNVTWNPKSVEESAVRSRRFARNSALSWAIDSLDAYLGYLRKKPFEFSDHQLIKVFSERSIYKSLKEVTRFCNYQTDLPLSIIHLGIQWRNNLVHFHADNELEPEYRKFLLEYDQTKVAERFRGLDGNLMVNNFDERNSPTLKEVAAIIQCIHFVVLELDKVLIQNVNLEDYIKQLIADNDLEYKNIMAASPDKRLKKFQQFLITKGFKETNGATSTNILTDEKIEKLMNGSS
ncbi:hypothetical protein FLAV_02187 [Flavobacteriales bacterium]|nr:hypothetical protein FLAV_02187 [Flavobacteriales bacterium]